MADKKISFVIPCYRSERTVMVVVDEIEATVATRDGFDYEIILVNDGSPDGVWNVIAARAERDEHVIGINLAKNFGQHCALMAGYNHASGDYVIALDDDGQSPANELYKLVDKLEEGFDIVYGTYRVVHQNLYRRLGSDFAHFTFRYLAGSSGDPNKTSFLAMRRFLVDEIIKYKYAYPFGLLERTTTNIGYVPVEQRERLSGTSNYTLASLIYLWVNGSTALSIRPLRIGTYCGILLACVGFLMAAATIVRKLFIEPDLAAGWSSIISAILIVGGMILLMLGLIGEYVGRIYVCISQAPQFVIREIRGKVER